MRMTGINLYFCIFKAIKPFTLWNYYTPGDDYVISINLNLY